MISTHDTCLVKRLSSSLLARGFAPKSPKLDPKMSASDFSSSFLNSLFPFPYLDFAFVRYPHEIQIIELEDEIEVFGFCDMGLIAKNSKSNVILVDDEERIQMVADDVKQFTKRFQQIVFISIGFEEPSQNDIQKVAAFGAPFWKQIAYALSEGDASPRRHLLTGFKDGMIAKL